MVNVALSASRHVDFFLARLCDPSYPSLRIHCNVTTRMAGISRSREDSNLSCVM